MPPSKHPLVAISLRKIFSKQEHHIQQTFDISLMLFILLLNLAICFVCEIADNNYVDDTGLYVKGQNWLNNKHIMGRAVG
jgi:hypothetical protein